MQRHHITIAFLIGAALWAGTVCAQDYEVRTYVADPSVATTDDASSTTETYQYLFNSVRQRYVCPYCSFSRDSAGTCPDPWEAKDHPATVTLVDLASQPRMRFLSLAAQAQQCGSASAPYQLEPKTDLMLPDAAGDLFCYMLLGRPYKPTDSDGNTVRSKLYAAAAGLINNTAAAGPVIAADDPVRWLVIPPTPLRRDANAAEMIPGAAEPKYGLPQRRPSAQVDQGDGNGGDEMWRPQVLDAQTGTMAGITPANLGYYLEISVNPYRVDEGDYWWVRYKERTELVGAALVTRRAEIEIYSVLYGYQGEVDAAGNPVPLVIEPAGGAIVFPFSVVADSGAVRLTIDDGDDGQPGWADRDTTGTATGMFIWTVGFMVRSNCRLIPGWQDLYDASVDPRFRKDINGNLDPGNMAFNLISDPFPGRKQPWMAAGSATDVPTVTTATDVEQTGNPPAGYTIPPNCTGEGVVAVQWRDPDPGTEAAWTPDPTADNAAYTVYYRNGYEWQYDGGVNGGAVTDISNQDVADSAATANYSAAYPYVHLAGARFMSTRTEAPRTATMWDRDNDAAVDEEPEAQGLALAYPKVILGLRRDVGGNQLVYGIYRPGATTAPRSYNLLNRFESGEATSVCNVCGAVWPPVWSTTDSKWTTSAPNPCPYHSVAAADIVDLEVSGAGNTSYNSPPLYTLQGTLPNPNNYPYYRKGATSYYIYHADPPKKRWLMATSTATGWKQAAYWNNNLIGTWNPGKEPGNPVVKLSTSSSSGVKVLTPRGGGAYNADQDVWREATALGADERTNPATAARHALPATAFKTTASSITATRNNDPTGGSDPQDLGPGTNQVWAEIPRQQPASVPGVGITNNYASDLGYRGGMVVFRNEAATTTAEAASGTTSPMTRGWDTFYRNPDNGYFQPSVGTWPCQCSVGGEIQWLTWATATPPTCPVHGAAATTTEMPGRHYYCPRCGLEQRDSGTCLFDGATLLQMPVASAVRQEHLMAEEFDPFDVQVSVTRDGTALAQSTPAIEIGRVSPGVRAQQPDTTTGALTDHRGFPADVSPLPRTGYRPSEARATLRNESNLALALRVGNVHAPDSPLDPRSHGDYLRVGLDPWAVSWGRKAQSGPLTLDTLMPRVKNPAADDTADWYESNLLNQALWRVLAPGTEDVAGEDTWLVAGNTTRVPAAGLIGAGTAAKPVPFSQPVGIYVGRHPQYLDLNDDGAFQFNHWDGSGYVATNTDVTEYNPATDMPLEPLVGMLEGQMRVVESRLPQNDYYAADNDPIVLPSSTAGAMQVIWSSNRVSADSSQGGYSAAAVAAGTDPGDMPTSRTALNLIYVTAAGATDANDPLYRQYTWPTSGGVLTPPRALTDQPDSTAGRMANSAPWAMYDLGGNKWSFWHRTQPHAGGVESTLRYNGPLGAGSWNWTVASEKFIYDTGLPKQGMRGFWGPNGAWLFWHEGTPGREQLMFRWNFDGTATSNEALVPVTNQARAGITDLVNAPTLTNGTTPAVIRKAGTSPFTYTRDTSVFLNTPSGGPATVNVFFSGFVTHEGQADICWTKFNGSTMTNAASGVQWANDNYSKLPFPRVTDEEMEGGGLHQVFAARHLDWLVGRNPASDMPVTRAYIPGGGLSPAFRLQLGYHDIIGDNLAPPTQSFDIGWDDSNDNTYDRARGVYNVTPVFYAVSGSELPARCAIGPAGGPWRLRDPNSPAGQPRPLTMTINPAAGTVTFSSPLFNEDAPTDRTAAFWSSDQMGGMDLEQVVLHAAYTPYVYRVTRSGAADDSPSAFWDPSTGGRLTVFWRRSFPASEAPHFGRPAYMYKCYTTSIQVGRPPVTGNPTITDWFSGTAANVLASNNNAGIYTIDPATGQAFLRVEYDDGTVTRVERHQVIGWSQEMVVPVDTVVGEGAMVAVPEAFDVPRTEGADPSVNGAAAVRYWLFWSSPRGVYDLRLVENGGTRVEGDLLVHPSSDIYSAVVAPDFGSLVPERTVPAIEANPT